MAVNLIIDTEYMRDVANKVKQANGKIMTATSNLLLAQHKGMDDIPEREFINETLEVAIKWLSFILAYWTGPITSALNEMAAEFDSLVENYTEIENDVKEGKGSQQNTYVPNDQNQNQTTVSESDDPNSNFYQNVINNSGGWDASGGWDTVGATFPNKRPDLNSVYYTGNDPVGRQRAYGKEGRHGSDSIDCCFYARARAMEVTGWTQTYGTYTKDYTTEAIKTGNRVVRFDTGNGSEMHFVFVEHYDPKTDTVYFSDSNMSGSPATDGQIKSKSFDDFLNYFPKGRYAYTENP